MKKTIENSITNDDLLSENLLHDCRIENLIAQH